MNTKKKLKKNSPKGFTRGGFSLMELIVSIAIFSMVFISVMGAFVSVMDAYEKITTTRTNVDNFTGAMESMVREAKTGTNYHCGSGTPLTAPTDCAAGDTFFSFVNMNVPRSNGGSVNAPIAYQLLNGRILRSDDGGANWYPVTAAPPVVNITFMKFYVTGTAVFPDVAQPETIVVIKGTIGVKANVAVPFSIQTTISQRSLDVAP